MLFSSLTFLFIFLPIIVIFYYIVKNRKIRNCILLLFSLLFYAWGEPKYILLMLFIISVSYIFGLIIDFYDKKKCYVLKKMYFIVCILIILFNLIYFKYTNFILSNINYIFSSDVTFKEIILPIGISFYTFQILSYIIDLYRNKINVQKNPLNLALYVALFPQLIAGPIVRYSTVVDELDNRKETFDDFVSGLKRFIIGLSKKVIISNNVAILADFVFDQGINYRNDLGTIIVWLGIVAYGLQIYYDFSGYSDMAIGLGKMFGFHFLENFNYPYVSKSITEFWRRWHISLSSWFRDYVYIPLGGNRVSKIKWIFNILIVWMLTGLWHGASWNFILWGLYFGIILLLEKLFLKKILDKLPGFIRWIYSIVLILIGWIIFRANNVTDILFYLKKLFDFSSTNLVNLFIDTNFSISFIYIIIGIIFIFPIYKVIENKFQNSIIYECINSLICLCLLIICIMFLTSSNYNPFIYFRF